MPALPPLRGGSSRNTRATRGGCPYKVAPTIQPTLSPAIVKRRYPPGYGTNNSLRTAENRRGGGGRASGVKKGRRRRSCLVAFLPAHPILDVVVDDEVQFLGGEAVVLGKCRGCQAIYPRTFLWSIHLFLCLLLCCRLPACEAIHTYFCAAGFQPALSEFRITASRSRNVTK